MTMAEEEEGEVYPRPDFERDQLRWQSLNGPWDFVFDDEDVGLTELWHHKGLPSEVKLGNGQDNAQNVSEGRDSLMETISAHPDRLVKDNVHTKSTNVINQQQKIIVPYVFQCPASGINDRTAHEVLWYEREINDLRTTEEKDRGDRVIIRFGAVDYSARVWVEGTYVGEHIGGHVPFDIDITDILTISSSTSKRLTVRVFDSTDDLTQPRGKQYWKPKSESIFYTPSSGIWQSVWLEVVPSTRIADSSHGTVIRSDDIENGILHANIAILGRRAGQGLRVQITASLAGKQVAQSEMASLPRQTDNAAIDLPMHVSSDIFASFPTSFQDSYPQSNPQIWAPNTTALWSPTHPLLYTLTISLYPASASSSNSSSQPLDTINTQSGMRSLRWSNTASTFLLNNTPLFQALVLDQGYWPQTFLTPPSLAALRADISLSKSLGFNGCRKHQKVESPLFLYLADTLGYLVWGEVANAYAFSSEYAARFSAEWTETVKRDRNHPCIVTWTPVNESWGYTNLDSSIAQRNHIRALYYATKVLDPSRPVNDNCGWEHVMDDLTTFHDYSDGDVLTETCRSVEGILAPKSNRVVFVAGIEGDRGCGGHRKGAPIICTEFGGVNIAAASEGDREAEASDRESEAAGINDNDSDNANDNDDTRDWGYTTASDPNDLLSRISKMVMGIVSGGHICGFVYTQLVDIEQEVNGLLTYDRQPKLPVEKVRAVMEEAVKVYHEKLEGRLRRG